MPYNIWEKSPAAKEDDLKEKALEVPLISIEGNPEGLQYLVEARREFMRMPSIHKREIIGDVTIDVQFLSPDMARLDISQPVPEIPPAPKMIEEFESQRVFEDLVYIFGVAFGDSIGAMEGRIDGYLSAYPGRNLNEEKLNQPFYQRKLKDSISVPYSCFIDVPDNTPVLGDWQPNKFNLGRVLDIQYGNIPPLEVTGSTERLVIKEEDVTELKKISRFDYYPSEGPG